MCERCAKDAGAFNALMRYGFVFYLLGVGIGGAVGGLMALLLEPMAPITQIVTGILTAAFAAAWWWFRARGTAVWGTCRTCGSPPRWGCPPCEGKSPGERRGD